MRKKEGDERPVTGGQKPAVTISPRLREFFRKNREGSSKQAAEYAQIDYSEHASLIRKIRAQVKRERSQRYLSISGGALALPHDFRFGPVQAPGWLVELIEWSWQNKPVYFWKRVKASNLVYYSRNFGPSIMHVYPKSRKALLHIHNRRVPLPRIFNVVALDLTHMVEKEGKWDEQRKTELGNFLEALKEEQYTYHVPLPVQGIEFTEKFSADLDSLGIRVRHDGSHRRCIEFEFSKPVWVRGLESKFEAVINSLDKFIEAFNRAEQGKAESDPRKYT